MKSRKIVRRQNKKTKHGAGFFSSKCGVMNPRKSYSDNRRNCLKVWKGKNVPGFGTIKCNRSSMEDYNFPSNPECINDVKERDFSPTANDDIIDGKEGTM